MSEDSERDQVGYGSAKPSPSDLVSTPPEEASYSIASSESQSTSTGYASELEGPEDIYSVSVRSLCEFTAKRGNLDRRFTPSATALEGIQGQQTIALRRGPDYETEISLRAQCGALLVRGRADGYDPRRHCLEEIKTIRGRPDDIPQNRRFLHWAQLETYGAMFCRDRGLSEIALSLVYFDLTSQTETELRQVFGAEELEKTFTARCSAFAGWAEQETNHRLSRNTALSELKFPNGDFRAGQRQLSEAVYRAAISGRSLLTQAPTGIGKTVGTLFPLLKAVPVRGIDKVAYLTCKGTGRVTALDTLAALRSGTNPQALRVMAIVPKDQGCVHPDKACHGDSCPLARGFYDRLPVARQEAVALGWLDASAQQAVALRHGICPYYLGQELVRWSDVLVGDVHHLFDSNGQLWGLSQALDWKLAVLVDEAHNLVERTRQMYSAQLSLDQIQDVAEAAPISLQPALAQLAEATATCATEAGESYAVLDTVPDCLVRAVHEAAGELSEHFQQQPLATGSLLNFHFGLQRFLRLVDALNDHSLFEVQSPPRDERGTRGSCDNSIEGIDSDRASAGITSGITLGVRNIAPAPFLRQRFQSFTSVTLFSATLAPPEYVIQLLGMPEDTLWVDVPSSFPPEHLTVRVAKDLSTRYADRDRSLKRLVDIIAAQFQQHPGNYLAFFSSFEYLEKACSELARLHPSVPQWRQDRRMGPAARQEFLARFEPHGRGIGFAVLGGVFAEGVDLPGTQLIGAFIATLGLPPVTVAQDHVKARLNKLFDGEHGYADLVPAMQKVIQAAGRVIRTPEDQGWLWLLDERYQSEEVVALLPQFWRLHPDLRGT